MVKTVKTKIGGTDNVEEVNGSEDSEGNSSRAIISEDNTSALLIWSQCEY